MPYKKTYRKRPRKVNPSDRKIKSIVRSEIKRDDKKDHPLQWVDILFTGDYIKTTPTVSSFTSAIQTFLYNSDSYKHWPLRRDSPANLSYRQANVYITGYNYQLRFQQNEQATIVTTDSARALMYSFSDQYIEDATSVFQGGDIDKPPDTLKIERMYTDRMFSMKATITETTTDDSQFVPGYKILKGWKKLNHKFMMEATADAVTTRDGGDIRLDMISTDNSVVGNVELFGYVRVYFRVIA